MEVEYINSAATGTDAEERLVQTAMELKAKRKEK